MIAVKVPPVFTFHKEHNIHCNFRIKPALTSFFCGQVKDLETHLQRLKSDLHHCVGFIQEPKKLKDSVQVIYARYVPHDGGVSGPCSRSLSQLSLVGCI